MIKNSQNILEKVTPGVIFISFFVAITGQCYDSLEWGHNSWQMTEWLINYAGGFIRRGLPGQLIYLASPILNIPGNLIVIAISLIAFFALAWVLIYRSAGRLSLTVICSPLLLGAIVYDEFIIRKDILGLLLLTLCLLIEKKYLKSVWKNLLINGIGTIALLSHEEFFFFGFSALAITRYSSLQESPGKILFNAIRTCAALSPLIIVFLITSIYHGNAEIAHAINASLFDLWRTITPNACCLSTPGGAINALQWSAQKGLSLSYEVLSEFSYGVYAPLALACSILFCFIYLTGLLQNSQSTYPETATDLTEEKSRLAFLLFLQFICIFPLFILGRDFGRWIFCIYFKFQGNIGIKPAPSGLFE